MKKIVQKLKTFLKSKKKKNVEFIKNHCCVKKICNLDKKKKTNFDLELKKQNLFVTEVNNFSIKTEKNSIIDYFRLGSKHTKYDLKP